MTAEPGAVADPADPGRPAAPSRRARRPAHRPRRRPGRPRRPRPAQALRRPSRPSRASRSQIHEGETYGLLGPNGAGKTTTISMVCGLLARDAGEVTLDGRADRRRARSRPRPGIGYVPQELAIYPDLTARENLAFFGRLYGLGGAALKARVERGPRAHRPRRARQRPHRPLQRRHAAPAQHRHRAAPPAAAAAARRAHRRRGPAEPQRDPRVDRRPGPPGHGDPLHDPLHGGGRAALRPRSGSSTAARSAPRARQKELVALIGQRDKVRLALTGDVARGGPGGGRGARASRRRRPRATSVEVLTADAGRVLPRAARRGRGRRARTSAAWRSCSRTSRPCSSTSPVARCATPSSEPAEPPMRVALLVALKDLRQRLRDRSALLVSIAAPLGPRRHLQPAARRGDGLPRRRTSSRTWTAATLATVLREDVIGVAREARASPRSTTSPTEAAARAAVEDGTADAAFLDPGRASRSAIGAGQAVTLEVVGARDAGLATEIARALGAAVRRRRRRGPAVGGDGAARPRAGRRARVRRPTRRSSARIVGAAAASAPPPVALVDGPAALRQLSWSTYFAASMAILFLFFSAQMGLVSLFDERRQGTLGRILAGPVRPWTVLAGKTLGGFVLGVARDDGAGRRDHAPHRADWGPPLGRGADRRRGRHRGPRHLHARHLVHQHAPRPRAPRARPSRITLGVLGGTFSPTAQAPGDHGRARPAHAARLVPARPRRHAGWRRRSRTACRRSGVLLAMGLVTGAHRHGPGAAPGAAVMIQLAQGPRDRAGQPAPPGPRPQRPVLRVRAADDHHRRARAAVRRAVPGAARASWRRPATPRPRPSSPACGTTPPGSRSAPSPTSRRSRRQVERGQLEAGIVDPGRLRRRRSRAPGTVEVRYLGTPDSLTAGIRAPIDAAVAKLGAITMAAASSVGGGPGRRGTQAAAAAAAGYETVPGRRGRR